jgi:hypothetical protein
MVDILLSTEDVSVFGGPSQIDVSIDYGTKGDRGTFIFTGNGKPTDADVDLPSIQPLDLYINLKPSDTEYLFLYQYGNINGVLQWSRVLRLIPNTALANIPVIFYNGEAVTFVPEPGAPAGPSDIDLTTIIPSPIEPSPAVDGMLWLDLSKNPLELKVYVAAFMSWIKLGSIIPGLSFPIGEYFTFSELGTLAAENFNIQYVMLSENPIASGLTLGELTEVGSKIFLPVFIKATETEPFDPLSETVVWKKVTGIKTLSFVVTANIGTLEL